MHEKQVSNILLGKKHCYNIPDICTAHFKNQRLNIIVRYSLDVTVANLIENTLITFQYM